MKIMWKFKFQCKLLLKHPRAFTYILPRAYTPSWMSVVVTETGSEPKIFTLWFLIGKVC